ncbi:PstS family phosphate ABC transporter substrate-binding protein [Aeromonas simiae]|uniref:PstS family phosphate ABC transporter substrate-binding protein n=1 Tax=Aeromonas simiae TaxID=218936 RepID=UPI00266BED47|nr:phosphate ABC transporter substrate-binding protein PstS family protein [Aeromonas simiae]MDO2947039.1 phosphate ABC transporter substrate-binding protein PstS family protein [Aeromonas simiae]MDO2950651.1 phosphate ABC transporter substrate-binding protein PstS family protein [Aeromonas simiae]MDO2954367.1 phosphate ABC transporter substrate-binding protein PstS family protein [Aeromonas simiae]
MKLNKLAGVIGLSTVALFSAHSMAAAVDSSLPDYQPISGISGNLSSVGSDTLANMMTLWAEEFKRMYPNVNVQIQAAGSSTAPTALTEGVAQFGPMSREMKAGEIEAFEKRYGYKPTGIPVAVDALAVFVNKDNPVKGLTMEQVDSIFSSTLKCGGAKQASRWSDVGLTGEWAAKDIQLYGRNSVSGTYGYFKEHALCKGDFKSGVNEQPGSASVVQSVSSSLNGIGYSGIGYVTSGVRAVPLSKDGKTFVEATEQNALTGKYPLSRFLYVYVNKHPNKPLSPMEQEFIKMILSKSGQSIVAKDGYIPLPGKVVENDLKKLGLM